MVLFCDNLRITEVQQRTCEQVPGQRQPGNALPGAEGVVQSLVKAAAAARQAVPPLQQQSPQHSPSCPPAGVLPHT